MTNNLGRTDKPKTCATCRHWHQMPKDATNLGQAPPGECREGPPHCSTLIAPNGNQLRVSNFPIVPPNHPACGRHEPALKLADAG